MSAKDYLKQLKLLDIQIKQKVEELESLKSAVTGLSGIDYAKDPVMTSRPGEAPYVQTVNRMIDLSAEINREIDDFADKKHLIIDQIQGLGNADEVDLLYYRYIQYLTFEKIADKMYYSTRHIFVIHRRALQHFEDKYLSA